jgi:hypothetical protein
MPDKRVLIIGINTSTDYEYQVTSCVINTKLMASMIINKFNFHPTNINMLLDEQSILDVFDRTFMRAKNSSYKVHQSNKNINQQDYCGFYCGFNLKRIEH